MGRASKNNRPGSLLSGLPVSVLSSLSSAAGTNENTVVGTRRPAEPDTPLPQSRPAKKQKLEGLLGPGWEQFDATNVVPFYQEQKDVPEKLKKCEHNPTFIFRSIQHRPIPRTHRLLSAKTIFLTVSSGMSA